jgi:hypothetical protein
MEVVKVRSARLILFWVNWAVAERHIQNKIRRLIFSLNLCVCLLCFKVTALCIIPVGKLNIFVDDWGWMRGIFAGTDNSPPPPSRIWGNWPEPCAGVCIFEIKNGNEKQRWGSKEGRRGLRTYWIFIFAWSKFSKWKCFSGVIFKLNQIWTCFHIGQFYYMNIPPFTFVIYSW